MFDPSPAEVRRFFCEAWRKRVASEPATPLEVLAADWIAEHPEYHGDLADVERAIAADYPVEAGRTNPFLHLSMHLAIAEQLGIDQPPGIRDGHRRLAARLGDAHAAAHALMECLGEVVWRAQRDRRPPDQQAYLECIRRAAGGPA